MDSYLSHTNTLQIGMRFFFFPHFTCWHLNEQKKARHRERDHLKYNQLINLLNRMHAKR